MADSDLIKGLREVHASIHDKVFKSTMSGPSVDTVNTYFSQIGMSNIVAGQDTIGDEAIIGETLAKTKITGVHSKQVSYSTAGVKSGSARFYSQAGPVSGVLNQLNVAAQGTQSVSFFYDTYLQGNLSLSQGVVPGGRKAQVPVKAMLQRFFSEIPFEDSRLETVMGSIQRAQEAGQAQPGTGMGYLAKAVQMAGGGRLDNPNALEAIFNAAYLRSLDRGPMGLQSFKQFLSNFGVEGLAGTEQSIWRTTDPFGIEKLAGQKPSTKSYASYVATEAGSNRFLGNVEKVYGQRYRRALEDVVRWSFSNAGDSVAFAMNEAGAIFMGRHGVFSSFEALPAQFLDDPIGVSRAGMPSGVVNIGGQLRQGRPMWGPNGPTSYAEMALGEFSEGLTQRGGLTSSNAPVAIHAAAKRMRTAGPLQDALDNVVSRGQFGFYSAMFGQGSMMTQTNNLALFNEELRNLYNKVRRGQSTAGADSAMMRALGTAIDTMQSTFPGVEIAPEFLTSVKQDVAKGNLVPTTLLRHFFLPDSTLGEREVAKGLHQVRGMLEVFRTSELTGIGAVNASLGIGNRAATLGMMSGDYAAAKALGRVYGPGSAISNLTGMKGMGGFAPTTLHSLYAVVNAPNASFRTGLFGDAGAFMTPAGKQAFGTTFAPGLQHETFMNRSKALAYLRGLAGKNINTPEWAEFIGKVEEGITGRGPFTPSKPLPIDPTARVPGLRSGITHLTSITPSSSPGFQEAHVKFNFGSTQQRGFLEGLFNRVSRFTARSASQGHLERTFGGLASAAHFIMEADTFNAAISQENVFMHRIGLLSTRPQGSTTEFLEHYQKFGGKGLIETQEGVIVPDPDSFNFANFRKASTGSLMKMGFSRGQIRGMYNTLGGVPGMASLLGQSEMQGDLSRLQTGANKIMSSVGAHTRLFFGAFSHRFDATSDILSQQKAFKVRLESLANMAQGIQELYGMPASKHPGFALMADTLTRRTGIQLAIDNSGWVDINAFVKSMPTEMMAPFAPMAEGENLRSWAAGKGIDILTPQEVAAKYDDASLTTLRSGKMEFENAMTTKLLAGDRKGFYIDTMDTRIIPGVTQDFSEEALKFQTRYVYVPGAEFLRRHLKGAEGLPAQPFKGSLVEGVLGLVESIRYGDREKPQNLGSVDDYVAQMYKGFIGWGGREGALRETMTSARMKMSARGRIVQQPMSVALAAADGVIAGKVRGSVYEVGISEGTLSQMFFGEQRPTPRTRAQFTQLVNRLRGQGKPIYGMLSPNPTHGAGHFPIVKFKLDDTLKFVGAHENGFSMSNFLAWTLNRDMDKDVIEAFMFEGPNADRLKNLGVMGRIAEGMDELFQKQRQQHALMHQAWQKGTQDAFVRLNEITDRAVEEGIGGSEHLRRLSAYYGFGNLPPVAFMPNYPVQSFHSVLASPIKGPDDLKRIANSLNRNASSIDVMFDAKDVAELRKLMKVGGMEAGQVWGHASLLQRNIFQAPITKGNKHLNTLLEDFIDIRSEIQKGMTPEEAINVGVQKARRFFERFMQVEEAGNVELSNLSKLKIDAGGIYDGLTNNEILEKVSQIAGRTQAVAAYAMARHDAQFGNKIHDAMGGPRGRLDRIVEFMFPGKRISLWSEKMAAENAEGMSAGAEQAIKGGSSQVLDATTNFLKKNWKGLGIAAGVVVGARAAMNLTTPSALAPQAPLPPFPNIGMQPLGAIPQLGQQFGLVMPAQGHFGLTNVGGTFNSVNSKEIDSKMDSSMSSFGNAVSNVNIRDSRRYTSNWEMQNIASRRGNSDFIHEYGTYF